MNSKEWRIRTHILRPDALLEALLDDFEAAEARYAQLLEDAHRLEDRCVAAEEERNETGADRAAAVELVRELRDALQELYEASDYGQPVERECTGLTWAREIVARADAFLGGL